MEQKAKEAEFVLRIAKHIRNIDWNNLARDVAHDIVTILQTGIYLDNYVDVCTVALTELQNNLVELKYGVHYFVELANAAAVLLPETSFVAFVNKIDFKTRIEGTKVAYVDVIAMINTYRMIHTIYP